MMESKRMIAVLVFFTAAFSEVVLIDGYFLHLMGFLTIFSVEHWNPFWILAIHTILVAGTVFFVRFLPRSRPAGKVLSKCALWLGFFFPGVGLPFMGLAAVGAISVNLFRFNVVGSFKEYSKYQKPEKLEFQTIDDLIAFIQNEVSIEPLADTLSSDEPVLRRATVESLRKIGTPTAISMIKKACSDPDFEVRIFANSALIRLENQMNERIEKAEKMANLRPRSPEAQLDHGKAILDYINSGILQTESFPAFISLASNPIIKANRLRPDWDETFILLGRLYLLKGDPVKAEKAFRKAMTLEEDGMTAEMGLAESLFEEGKWKDLVDLCRKIMSQSKQMMSRDNLEILEFWAK